MLQVYDVSIDYINSDDFRISTLPFFRDLVKNNTLNTIIQNESAKSLIIKPKVKSFYDIILKDVSKTKADEVLNKAVTKLLQDKFYDQQLLDQFITSSKQESFNLKDLSYYTDNILVGISPYDTKMIVDNTIASFVKRFNDGSLSLVDINRPKKDIPSTGTNQNNNSSSSSSNASLREIIADPDYVQANKNVFLNHNSNDSFNTLVVTNFLSVLSDKIYREYLLLTLSENVDADTYNKMFDDIVRERIRVEKFLGDSLLDTYLKILNNPTYEATIAKSKLENKPMAFIISLEIMNEEIPIQVAKQDLSTVLSLIKTKIKDELNKQFPADFFTQFPGIDVYLNDLSLAFDQDAGNTWSKNWADIKNSMKSNHDSDKSFANFLTYDAAKINGVSTSNVDTAGTGENIPDGTGFLDYYTPAVIASNYGNNSTVLMTINAIKDYLKRVYPYFKKSTPYPYLASPFGE